MEPAASDSPRLRHGVGRPHTVVSSASPGPLPVAGRSSWPPLHFRYGIDPSSRSQGREEAVRSVQLVNHGLVVGRCYVVNIKLDQTRYLTFQTNACPGSHVVLRG